jgi:predicted AlkP superfamily phosphohydrolase/phosphomutase
MDAKAFIFGIDGATFDVILPLVERGKLPNLGGLIRQAAWGPMRSTIHPITPAAWSSFATGRNPGKHGVYDFTAPNRQTYGFKLNTSRDRRCESVWGQLGSAGKRIIISNVPFTYPPERVNGILISGFDAPGADRSMANPPEAYDDLVSHFGTYTPDWSFPVGKKYEPEKYREEVAAVIRRRADATLYLMQRYPWEVFMTVFQSIDHIQHVFFGLGEWGLEFIRGAYEEIDVALGRIQAALDSDTTLFVVSDHGAGEIRKVFFLDQWLEQEKYLVPKRGAWLEKLGHQIGRKGERLAKRLLPVRTRGYLRGRMPALRNVVVSYNAASPVDWARTRAYSGGMYGNIFLNLRGRESQGIVEESQYHDLCVEIRSRLMDLKDPETGEKVVEAVYQRDEIYQGPWLADAPDLLIHWKDYAYYTKKGLDRKGMIFSRDLTVDASSYPHSGTHRLDGIFLAAGPRVREASRLPDLRIVDVAPSLLYLFGESVPDDMDGRVRTDLFADAFVRGNEPRYHHAAGSGASSEGSDTVDPQAEEELRRRLQSLGYLE